MQKVTKTLDVNVYSETLRCEVRGMKGPLADTELEKAASSANEFLSTIGKKP